MQHTITHQKVSFNLIALVILLVAIALGVGFVTGRASNNLAALVNSAVVQTNAPMSGWVYHHDSLTNKWYAYHYATTSTGHVIDDTIELPSAPEQ
jgi:hypothetical protein